MSIKTIGFVLCAILTLSFPVAGQQTRQVPRIGYLSPLTSAADAPRREGFQRGLRERGYIEGQNITVEYRFAEGKLDRLTSLANELAALKVVCIVAGGGSAIARAAKNAAGSLPIVMTNAEDPVADRLIATLAHPGGNVTGLTAMLPDLAGKRLEILKESIPKITRVAVLWNSAVPEKAVEFKETQVAAKGYGLRLQSSALTTQTDFDGVFEASIKEHAEAMIMLPDPLVNTLGRRIVEIAAKRRLPTMFSQTAPVQAGGLMSYGPSYPELFRRAANYVDKIIKGAKPADLPVEQPMSFEFVINLKAAKQIGVTIPPEVLARASTIIR